MPLTIHEYEKVNRNNDEEIIKFIKCLTNEQLNIFANGNYKLFSEKVQNAIGGVAAREAAAQRRVSKM